MILVWHTAGTGFKNLQTWPSGILIIIRFGAFCWRHSVQQSSCKVIHQPFQLHRPLRMVNDLGDQNRSECTRVKEALDKGQNTCHIWCLILVLITYSCMAKHSKKKKKIHKVSDLKQQQAVHLLINLHFGQGSAEKAFLVPCISSRGHLTGSISKLAPKCWWSARAVDQGPQFLSMCVFMGLLGLPYSMAPGFQKFMFIDQDV